MSVVSIDLLEWERCLPEPGSWLAGVELEPAAWVQAQALTRSGMLEVADLRQGPVVQATSFVGRLQLGQIRVTVRPKITGAPLLGLFRYAYGLRNLTLFKTVGQDHVEDAFQDLLCHQLAAETEELLARGLHRTYRRVGEALASPRGRILFAELARQGGLASALLPCEHYPRLDDVRLNQVLLAGLKLAARLTSDLALRAHLRRLAARLADRVAALKLTRELLRQARHDLNRLTSTYQPALTLIELLAEAEGVTLDEASAGLRLPGFLFDMNRFFQALLSRFLRENLPGYVVQDEYRIRTMMAYRPDRNPRRRRDPEPRPDYLILKHGQPAAMLDAKYRDLWNRDLPRDMLYQLAIYALSQSEGGLAAILYPTTDPSAREAQIDIRHPQTGHPRASVSLRPVNLLDLYEVIADRRPERRSQIARRMAFGSDSWLSQGAL